MRNGGTCTPRAADLLADQIGVTVGTCVLLGSWAPRSNARIRGLPEPSPRRRDGGRRQRHRLLDACRVSKTYAQPPPSRPPCREGGPLNGVERSGWGRRDSNPHWRRFKRPASADWATSPQLVWCRTSVGALLLDRSVNRSSCTPCALSPSRCAPEGHYAAAPVDRDVHLSSSPRPRPAHRAARPAHRAARPLRDRPSRRTIGHEREPGPRAPRPTVGPQRDEGPRHAAMGRAPWSAGG